MTAATGDYVNADAAYKVVTAAGSVGGAAGHTAAKAAYDAAVKAYKTIGMFKRLKAYWGTTPGKVVVGGTAVTTLGLGYVGWATWKNVKDYDVSYKQGFKKVFGLKSEDDSYSEDGGSVSQQSYSKKGKRARKQKKGGDNDDTSRRAHKYEKIKKILNENPSLKE